MAATQLLTMCLLAVPIVVAYRFITFLRVELGDRRIEVENAFDYDVGVAYMATFGRQEFARNGEPRDISAVLKSLYREHLTFFNYAISGGAFLLLSFAAVLIAAPELYSRVATSQWPEWRPADALLFGTLGAVAWTSFDLLILCQARRYRPTDGLRLCIRLVIAPMVAVVFASATPQAARPIVALFVGAVPVKMLLHTGVRAIQRLISDTTDDAEHRELIAIRGIGEHHASVLENVGIRSVEELAHCDPVAVSLRSCLSFRFIIDVIDQAVLRTYVADDQLHDGLLRNGIRGCVSVLEFQSRLGSDENEISAGELIRLEATAAACKIDIGVLRSLFRDIAHDRHAILCYQIWLVACRYSDL